MVALSFEILKVKIYIFPKKMRVYSYSHKLVKQFRKWCYLKKIPKCLEMFRIK